MRKILIFIVRIYQTLISPLFPPSCRYYPTCSNYMIDALKKHGPILGLIMGISRIIKCNPFVRGGWTQFLIILLFFEIHILRDMKMKLLHLSFTLIASSSIYV